MYLIKDYQIISINEDTFVYSDNKAAKSSNQVLSQILSELQGQDKLKISETELNLLAKKYQINLEQLKEIFINQLDILKPLVAKQFSNIYLNTDITLITTLLNDSLTARYNIHVVAENFSEYADDSLVLFYRNNYSSHDFKTIYQQLPDNVYLITAGIIHKILVIDNLYYNHSGLPTHLSNLQQLMTFLHGDLPSTKDNWLLFYRSLVKNNVDMFPEPFINPCQQGFVAYALHQFIVQFTDFWRTPTPIDQINYFWHVDLTNFTVHKEVAIHSPFSEYDMKLNLANLTCWS